MAVEQDGTIVPIHSQAEPLFGYRREELIGHKIDLLGWLDERTGSPSPTRMKIPITHEDIGWMMGTSRETVTRLMAGFRKQPVIEQEGATLVVANRMARESLITA